MRNEMEHCTPGHETDNLELTLGKAKLFRHKILRGIQDTRENDIQQTMLQYRCQSQS
jgi:hypothetical protein